MDNFKTFHSYIYIDQQKVPKKEGRYPIYYMQISCNINNVRISENIQNKTYKLQNRLEKSTDPTEKLKNNNYLELKFP